MDNHLIAILSTELFPVVHLNDLQALGSTCKALAAAMDGTPPDTWLKAARNTLPEDHPLCSAPDAGSIPERAAQLSQLHNRLRSGKIAEATSFQIRRVCGGLRATANHQGTMLVSENGRQLYLHSLAHSPKARLQRIMKQPSPEMGRRGMLDHSEEAVWAPDDSAVLLMYYIESEDDLRAEDGSFQVVHLLDVASQKLSYITDTNTRDEHPRLLSACFTPDSRLVLTVFEPCGPAFVDVRTRCGTRLRLISPPQASHEMAIAAPTSTQVVCNHDAGVSVWDLPSGQQVGAVGPLQSEGDSDMATNCRTRCSLIATNATGSRLAFLAAGGTAVQLFDAKSLSSLGSFGLPANKLPARCSIGEVELSMHGCLLRQEYPSNALHFCLPEQASGVLREMLQFELAHTPLCVSADGAFACAYKPGQLKIWDTASWQVVLEYGLDLPEEVVRDLRHVALTWSSCGLRLLVRAVGKMQGRSSDKILLLQL